MAINSGLVALVTNVQSYFTSRSITANVSLGWKQETKQINQGPGRANRVVFIPSPPSGAGGRLVGAQQPGPRRFGPGVGGDTSARSLFTWERQVLVSVWAADTSDPHNETKQLEAIEDLFELTVRAVHAATQANAQWGEVTWVLSPNEHTFGRELRAALSFAHPLFDDEVVVKYPGKAITRVLES
jgi:hypothetical protein